MDVVDRYEKYQKEKHSLTKEQRNLLIKGIVNVDAYITDMLLEIALDEDIDYILDLTLKVESENVVDFLLDSNRLNNKQLNLLAEKILTNKKLLSIMKNSYKYSIKNHLKIKNLDFIKSKTELFKIITKGIKK